ncbi:hypothetical protein [Geobacter sp.]|uniref:hypothetical protein n=1 Tax=Geobacter sp. TaxID=46610 RepID=UPI00260D9464|nr:hypothetical protein [Geobacter sp.]
MVRRVLTFLFKSRRRVVCTAALLLAGLFLSIVHFRFYGHLEGIYVLKGKTGGFEVKDDLIFGDEDRIVLALPAEPIFKFLRGDVGHAMGITRLDKEWFRFDGSGYVRSYLADGTSFLMCFSRFIDSAGLETKGVFVGGGLPFDLENDRRASMSESGMAYYNGKEWLHIWCNVNESIASWHHPEIPIAPSTWRFLGSSVRKKTEDELVLTSSHEVDIDGTPFRIDRTASFKAGSRHTTLAITISNVGQVPAGYFYVYGDEPWVGEYGSSAGNVGWVQDRLIKHEATINPLHYGWAGYFDYGNDAAGEKHDHSGVANFIEWQAGLRPDLVYFSNKIGTFAEESARVPLASDNNRVIFLQWGPRMLSPGQSETIILSVGMADRNPANGFPVKPDTSGTLRLLLSYLAPDA